MQLSSLGGSSDNPDTPAVSRGTFHDGIVPMRACLQSDVALFQKVCACEAGHNIQDGALESALAVLEQVGSHAWPAARRAEVGGGPRREVTRDANVCAAIDEVADAVYSVGVSVLLALCQGPVRCAWAPVQVATLWSSWSVQRGASPWFVCRAKC